ncbi:MAG TPA: DUF1641 domain-containing protein [Thermoplasmataceae archaeon]|nr:DUF1641 domain-containing protein [Thermoplasmatales archaeon AK]HLH85385.1 DUF1641 domain-containing protein [Thermoplasmataceae archaeon]
MVTDEAKLKDMTSEEDDIEVLIDQVLSSKDELLSLVGLFKKLKESGLINVIENLSADFLPSDLEFIASFLTSRDFLYGFVKGFNVLSAALHAISSERASDAIKSILFNSDAVWEGMVAGAKNPQATSFLRLYAMLKDPDTAAGLTAVLNALKAIGYALRKVPDE